MKSERTICHSRGSSEGSHLRQKWCAHFTRIPMQCTATMPINSKLRGPTWDRCCGRERERQVGRIRSEPTQTAFANDQSTMLPRHFPVPEPLAQHQRQKCDCGDSVRKASSEPLHAFERIISWTMTQDKAVLRPLPITEQQAPVLGRRDGLRGVGRGQNSFKSNTRSKKTAPS